MITSLIKGIGKLIVGAVVLVLALIGLTAASIFYWTLFLAASTYLVKNQEVLVRLLENVL